MKQTIEELQRLQSQPLETKIQMTRQRIREWVTHYGESNVYVSFSGGKDSTVLLDIVRKMGYEKVPAVFVDVPTQFPELKTFAEREKNLEIIKPKKSFYEVCAKYGFPLISKEVSDSIYVAKKYLEKLQKETGIKPDANSDEFANLLNQRMKSRAGGANQRLAILLGMLTKDKDNPITTKDANENKSTFTREKYQFLLFSPFDVSARCCNIMKKYPAHEYARKTGRLPMTAQMTEESRLRKQKWLLNGCNAFDLEYPISNPMSFWTEDDVLEYIYKMGIPICSVYGDVVEDYGDTMDGQLSLNDFGCGCGQCRYKTTGCKRTGCVLCGYGAGTESYEDSRFVKLKETHPKFYALLDVIQNKGITFRQAIEWINKKVGNRGHIWL